MKQIFKIKDFKGFEDLEVPLNQLTVFVGSNSVGKSSIIQALLLSRFAYDRYEEYGDDIGGTMIPMNGPFLLELGNTAEVIRRGKRVSNMSEIIFTLIDDNEILMELRLSGDATSQNSFELNIEEANFNARGKYIMGNTFYYSAAERIGPRLKYEYTPQIFPHSGYRGERSFQILSGPNIAIDSRKVLKPHNPQLLYTQVYDWLEYIIPGAKFDFAQRIGRSGTIEATYNDSLPTNVGFGISYVLPIIINGLLAEEFSSMIVENPEAHLHPAGQSRIGEFLTKVAASNVQVLIETHSEHVINGIRISTLNDIINAKSVAINFLKRALSDTIEIEPLTLTIDSDLSSYPTGFFDQEERDLAKITRLRRSKNR